MTNDRFSRPKHSPRDASPWDSYTSPSIDPSSLAERIKNQRVAIRGLFDHWYIAPKRREGPSGKTSSHDLDHER